MNFNNPNQPRQPPMQHPGMQQGPGPGQQSMMRRPMNAQRRLVTEANIVEYISKLPPQYQQIINNLPSLEDKIQMTQNLYDKLALRQAQQQQGGGPQQINMQQQQGGGPQQMNMQQQQGGGPQQMNMQQQQGGGPQHMNMQQPQRQLAPGAGQGIGQQMPQQRMNMQRMPQNVQMQQRSGLDGSMMFPGQPPMPQQPQQIQQQPQQTFQPKMEIGYSQQAQGQFQPKVEPGQMQQQTSFQSKVENSNFPGFQVKQEPGLQQSSGGFMGQPGQGQFQPPPQQQRNAPFPGPGPESNERMQQPPQQFQRANIPQQQQPQKTMIVPFPGPGPDANERHQRIMQQNQPPPQQPGQQQSQRMPPPSQNQRMPNQPPSMQFQQRDGQMQNFQTGQMPMRQIQQQGSDFFSSGPGQQQMIGFPGSGPQQQSQQQNSGFPGQPPLQQGGPFPNQTPKQGFYQQSNQQPPQMFSQQQRPQVLQQFQQMPQPTPPQQLQQQSTPQPASQQTQPGSLLQPPSQGQVQGPSSHQPASQQGPSPAVQAVTSIGRAPTPSGRSNQSSGPISQEVYNSPDYQTVLKELCGYKDICLRLIDRMLMDEDPKVSSVKKTLEIIDGKFQVKKDLLKRVIKDLLTVAARYEVTSGIHRAVFMLQRQPDVDISDLIREKYSRFKMEYIMAPMRLYTLVERGRRLKNETLYLKKRMRWIDENGVDLTEPLKHPFPTVPQQFLRSKIYKKQFEDDGNIEPKEKGEEQGKSVKFDNARKYIDEDGFISCIVKVEDERLDIGSKNDFYDEYDEHKERNTYETVLPDEGITAQMYYEQGIYMHPIVTENNDEMAFLGDDANEDDIEKMSHKRQLEEENVDEPPNKKQKKDDDGNEKEFDELRIENLQNISKRKIATSRNVHGLTANDLAMNEAYFSYIKRQQEAKFDEPESMNAKLVRGDEKSMGEILPVDYPTKNPIIDKQHYSSEDCMFNCCVPYPMDSLIGRAARLPQAAATELRRFRHRPDNEFVPLSEHTQVFSVIINPSKFNGPRYPEIRIFIHKDYPRKPADYLIIIPSTIQSNSIKSFYRKLEEKMEDRRLSGQPMRTITEIISAFRIACDMVFRNRDILDFSKN